jgi:hypothetical protein
MSGWSIMEGVFDVPTAITDTSPEEWIFNWETHGKKTSGCSDPQKLALYKRGKAMRDWWFEEKGELKRLLRGLYAPEEFAGFLMPDCFFELFERYPITALVRQIHDSHYSQENFESDMRYRAMGLDPERDGYRVFAHAVAGQIPRFASE